MPFYLRTGKALGIKRTEVAIKFKQAPFAMFRGTPVDRLSENYLVIGIAPTEGITLQFNTKVPGPTIDIDGVEMKFRYKDYFKAEPSTGYETLIYDCMIGDNILFQRADSVEAGWQAVQPFLDAWKKAGAKGLQNLQGRQRRSGGRRGTAQARRPQLAQARLSRMSPRDNRHRIIVADPAALATAAAERLLARIAANQRPSGDLPDRRIEPETALPVARDRSLSQPDPVAPRALVHRRRAFRRRRTIRSTIWPWRGEIFLDRCAPAANIHPIPTDTADPDEAARRYERELQSFYGAERARSRPALVRSGADGRRARWPYRIAVSRLIQPSTRPDAGWSACPRRMSNRSCRGSR